MEIKYTSFNLNLKKKTKEIIILDKAKKIDKNMIISKESKQSVNNIDLHICVLKINNKKNYIKNDDWWEKNLRSRMQQNDRFFSFYFERQTKFFLLFTILFYNFHIIFENFTWSHRIFVVLTKIFLPTNK